MKKLIIAAAIVCAAVAVHAASASWNILNIASSPDKTAAAGWYVQIFDSSVTYDYSKALAGTITATSSATSYATGSFIKATAGGIGPYSVGDTVSWYAVVYDAGSVKDAQNYIVSKTLSKTIPGSGADVTLGFGNMNSTATTNMFRDSKWESVPEPTSGLLLLLGVAGLALRRKQK